MKNHPAEAGGISVPSKLRLPIRLKVGCQFAFHRLTPVVCAFDVIKLIFFFIQKKTPLWRFFKKDYFSFVGEKGIY